jgi:hypothetical protein
MVFLLKTEKMVNTNGLSAGIVATLWFCDGNNGTWDEHDAAHRRRTGNQIIYFNFQLVILDRRASH